MGILQAWKQSFSLLRPANFMQFLREWIQTSKQVYAVVFTHWVPIAVIVSIFISQYCYQALFKPYMRDVLYEGGSASITTQIFLVGLGLFLLNQLYNCVICAAGRSSTDIKNTAYFKGFIWHMSMLLIFMVAIHEIGSRLSSFVYFNIHLLGFTLILLVLECVFAMFQLFSQPFYLICVLCFLDTDGSVRQLWHSLMRTVKMMVFHLPLFVTVVCLVLLLVVPMALVGQQLRPVSWWIGTLVSIAYVPLVVSAWITVYNKLNHEQRGENL